MTTSAITSLALGAYATAPAGSVLADGTAIAGLASAALLAAGLVALALQAAPAPQTRRSSALDTPDQRLPHAA